MVPKASRRLGSGKQATVPLQCYSQSISETGKGKRPQARPGQGTANPKGAESRRRPRETMHKFQEGRIRAWGQIIKERNEIKAPRGGGFLVNAGQSPCLLHCRKGLLLSGPPLAWKGTAQGPLRRRQS